MNERQPDAAGYDFACNDCNPCCGCGQCGECAGARTPRCWKHDPPSHACMLGRPESYCGMLAGHAGDCSKEK